MGRTVRALLDSGAQGNYISPKVVNKYRIPWKEKDAPYQLRTVDGEFVTYGNGTVDMETDHLPVTISDHAEKLTCDITDISGYDMILGIPWLRASNPRVNWRTGQLQWDTPGRNYASTQPRESAASEFRKILRINVMIKESKAKVNIAIPEEYQDYADLFSGELKTGLPQHTQFDHEIPLKEGGKTHFMPTYRLRPEHEEALKEYLDENLRKGYIRPSTSEAGYPILFVPKKSKDGKTKWRLCIDFRKLNENTIKNRYPLPLISDLRDKLHGAQWFTALDLPNAYGLIRIKKGEEWKTAFRTKYGHYEYLVMPFGLTNAPASFQSMINHVLREYLDKFVVVYLDDILIFSKTLGEHKQHVRMILSKLQEANLLVNGEKSEFHQQKVTFVGYVVSPGEIRMEDSKIAAVKAWPTPTNVSEVRSFLGLANYYRMFIHQFGKIGTPLTNLTKKDLPFRWTEVEQTAFDTLKKRITDEPVLKMADPDKPFEVETDASDYAIGGQLSQRDDNNKLHPVAFFSKKLNGPELNYQIHDKELMAVIEAFREWRHYLSGTTHKVKVFTDHKNLTSFLTNKELNKRQIRWSEFLSEFNCEIIYRKGNENGRADALSRRPDHFQEAPKETHTLLRTNEHGNLEPTTQDIFLTHRVTSADSWTEKFGDTPKTYNNRIWIPPQHLDELIKQYHEAPFHGHQGTYKTWNRIRTRFDCENLKKHVANYIKTCDLCNKAKASRHKPYGEIQPIPPPDRAWKSIAWDWIVKLPLSKEPLTGAMYDSILVTTERLTKYAYFLPYKESSNTDDLAYTFLRTIVSQHGLPDEIISDRDKLFTSKFWKSLMARLGTNHKLSTAYHPQTDGQTERMNQTLEQYLRCYINYEQDNWVELLPIAQFAYNSSETESIGTTPFYANYGFNPDMTKEPLPGILAEKAITHADKLQDLQRNLQQELLFLQQRMKEWNNKKRVRGPTLKEGDPVYLLRKNIKTKRPNDKLDFKKIGPFKIDRVVSPVNYRLSLPRKMRIHPTFHISLLEPAPPNAKIETRLETEPDQEYEVEEILDLQKINGQWKYLVKWKDYPPSENTWEPKKNLKGCPELLADFHRQRAPAAQHPQNHHPNPGKPNPRR
ncbi:uncharacterized protein JN550_005614 [Neoarthrinium moseri]|uniref:uncharacterized protein n=1 Tax=Neoarthrinium moseri TaxID=1658444 RepID=UPI001FDB6ED5|nr:uncharacterized protein JN550_005614 [Neoarthrinium moseri]KAI1869633.1 hypothetical protein JN550_005614 [Neoarthrinium moseri]